MTYNPNIKAIPTTYDGINYRSRLEARWAIFFDWLNVKFEYELEGFQLPNNMKYLPDFYLPELKVFVEVKPTMEFDIQTLRKLYAFATHEDDINLLVACGSPGKDTICLFNRVSCPPLEEFEADEYSSGDELAKEYLDYLFKVKFYPQLFGGGMPEWKLAFAELPAFYDSDLIDAIKKSQYQFKDFKGK